MKKRLCVFALAAMVLISPILRATASTLVKLSGDSVITFPDPNFEAVVRELVEKPTGSIQAKDVAGITYLGVDMSGIVDLAGIEYFAALETLTCGENALTKLDVSKNTMLKKLRCNTNQLTMRITS